MRLAHLHYRRTSLFALAFSVSASCAVAAEAGDSAAGRRIYQSICAACHGPEGHNWERHIPRFADGERLDKDDAALMRSVRDGVGDRMPPWGGFLDDRQIADVIAYIRTLPRKARHGDRR